MYTFLFVSMYLSFSLSLFLSLSFSLSPSLSASSLSLSLHHTVCVWVCEWMCVCVCACDSLYHWFSLFASVSLSLFVCLCVSVSACLCLFVSVCRPVSVSLRCSALFPCITVDFYRYLLLSSWGSVLIFHRSSSLSHLSLFVCLRLRLSVSLCLRLRQQLFCPCLSFYVCRLFLSLSIKCVFYVFAS